MNELNEYMIAKFKVSGYESEDYYSEIFETAKSDVKQYLVKEKKNIEILEYINIAFTKKSDNLNEFIIEAENETSKLGLDKLTQTWIGDLQDKDKHIDDYIRVVSEQDIFYKRSDNKEKFVNKNSKVSRKLYYWWAAAAAVVLLFLYVTLIYDRAPQNERIFAQFHPQTVELTGFVTRSVDQNASDAFENALQSYRNSDFKAAYNLFAELAEKDPVFVQALFYSGVAQFESGQYNESIRIFEAVITRFDEYDFESEWLLALCYIKLNNYGKAIPYLENVASEKNNKQDDAKEILKMIKE